jgi:hypothetical protein
MRVIELIGVVEDGTPLIRRYAGAPVNPRVSISYQQGSTLLVKLKVLTASGAPVDISAVGTTVQLAVRKRPTPSGYAILTLTGVAPSPVEPGRMDFTFSATSLPATRVAWGRYSYEVALSRTAYGIDKVVPISPFLIEPGDL